MWYYYSKSTCDVTIPKVRVMLLFQKYMWCYYSKSTCDVTIPKVHVMLLFQKEDCVRIFVHFVLVLRPNATHGLLILRFLDHTQRLTTLGRTSGRVISSSQRPLYLPTRNTHNRQTSMPPAIFNLQSQQARGHRPMSVFPKYCYKIPNYTASYSTIQELAW
jgi:hypothetical protein